VAILRITEGGSFTCNKGSEFYVTQDGSFIYNRGWQF